MKTLPEKDTSEARVPEVQVNPETVCHLIQLAREFHAQDAVIIPEEPSTPLDDWSTLVLSAHQGDEKLQEFRNIIADLDRDQQVQVVGMLWLGRGDYRLDEWMRLLSEADAMWTEYTADYLIAHPLLADYLTEGLDLLGYGCE